MRFHELNPDQRRWLTALAAASAVPADDIARAAGLNLNAAVPIECALAAAGLIERVVPGRVRLTAEGCDLVQHLLPG